MGQRRLLSISQEQFDLLSNALRIRIMYALKDRARTAKQVAEELGESSGNVHYHIQKLFKGGLLDLVESKEVSGILEKYYQSKGDRFELQSSDQEIHVEGKTKSRILANFKVNEAELDLFMDEMSEFFSKWERRNNSPDSFEVVIDSSVIIRSPDGGTCEK